MAVRGSLRLLLPALVLAACSAEPALEVRVERDTVPAAPGEVAVRVDVSGGDAADVAFRTTYGEIKDVRVDGDAVVATWYGLVDPLRSPVELQVALGSARGRVRVRIVAGEAAAVAVTSAVPWVDADDGRAVLWATIVDAVGMPADGRLQATASAGRPATLVPEARGRWRIEVEDLRSVLDNPVVVSVSDGTSSAVTELTITAGAPGPYVIKVPTAPVPAAQRFPIELRSVDAWGNARPAFGEVAALRAFRRADPTRPVPISPVATNIFVGGAVTMDVSLHGAGPDIVIEAAAPASGPTTRSAPIQVLQVDPECVVVSATGLDGRIQESTSLGRAGGFPLQVIVYAQDCRDIKANGPDFSRRLAGLEPEIWAFLNDGTLWGSSLGPDTTPSTAFPGGERVGPVRFRPEDLSWRFEVTGLTQVEFSPVRVTAAVGDIVGQLNVEPTPSRWAGIRIEPIPDQFEGVGFSLPPELGGGSVATSFGFSAIATDVYGNQVPTAQGTLTCRLASPTFGLVDATLELLPGGNETVPPLLGIINQVAAVVGVESSALNREDQHREYRVVCQRVGDPSVAGYSNVFRVWNRELTLLPVDGIASDFLVVLPGQSVPAATIGAPLELSGSPIVQTAGQPFSVDIHARWITAETRPLWFGNLQMDALAGDLDLPGVAPYGSDPASSTKKLSKRSACVDLDGNDGIPPFSYLYYECGRPVNFLEAANPDFQRKRYSWVASQQVVLYTAGTQSLIANAPVPSLPPTFRSTAALAALPTTTFTVRHGAAAGFVLAAQPPTQATAGVAFPVAVQVVDAWGNEVTDYTGTIEIDDRSRALSPRSLAIVAGQAQGDLTVWTPIGPNQLTFTLPVLGKRRTSDVFLVVP